ncbi:APC family permease [Limosilactobacillus mucosae]
MNMQNKTDKLGFWSIVLLAINSIIGSGIFLTPGSVVTMVGTKAPLVYLIAAVFAAMLALTFAAAAKYVTKSGAAYSYAKAAYGENMGFYMGVVRFFSASVAWGVMGVGVIKSTLSIFGADSTNFKNITWGFVVLMAIILLINFFGQRFLTLVSDLSTIGKLLALGLIILAGIVIFLKTGVSHFHDLDTLKSANGQPLIPKLTTSGLVMAVIAAFYAFTGFESVASGSEDMENPQKNLPRAIPLAIMVIALVYIGTILVAMAIDPTAIVKTKQVVAIAAIFQARWLRILIELGALISMFGINLAASFHTPRVLEAMAKEHQAPQWLARRTKHDFPAYPFMITLVLAVFIPMAFQYNMTAIIVLSAMVRFFEFIVIPLGVIRFYRGTNVEPVLRAERNWLTDVLLPVLSVAFTIFLLFKFDWVGEFGISTAQGIVPNWFAIIGMAVGFVFLPAGLFMMLRHEKR